MASTSIQPTTFFILTQYKALYHHSFKPFRMCGEYSSGCKPEVFVYSFTLNLYLCRSLCSHISNKCACDSIRFHLKLMPSVQFYSTSYCCLIWLLMLFIPMRMSVFLSHECAHWSILIFLKYFVTHNEYIHKLKNICLRSNTPSILCFSSEILSHIRPF